MQIIIDRIPHLDGVQAYEIFAGDECSFLLDSSMVHERLGKFSFAGGDPFLIFRSWGSTCHIQYRNGPGYYYHGVDSLACLNELIAKYAISEPEPAYLPLSAGGAVGYFAYDMGRNLEKLPRSTRNDIGFPDCIMAFFDRGIILDHFQEESYIFSTGLPFQGQEGIEHRDKRFWELSQRVQNHSHQLPVDLNNNNACGKNLQADFSPAEYEKAVEKALDYIGKGDIYQVNLTQRFSATLESSPWELYRRLRQRNPAPFASFLCFPEGVVVSSSPERFLAQKGSRIETRPIKGTRPRGSTEEEDRSLRRELWESSKDQAELVMIVDLERNDLSRVCNTGTVNVPELFTLEEYATVHHLVSTVEGELSAEKNIVDVLRASFPGGSITGAPKIRAMEIIEELEPVRRGIYTGSIGYIDFGGQADLNIVIRTFITKNNRVYFQVGGGIVADSSPRAEYQETLDKAKALLGALGFEK